MLALPARKWSWLVAIGVTVVILGMTAWNYAKLRAAPEFVLVPVILSARVDPIDSYIARLELKRKIRSGEFNGATAVAAALQVAALQSENSEEALELADELLALGVDVNSQTTILGTPLHVAITTNKPLAVRYLLEHCADPGVPMVVGPDGSGQKLNAMEYAYYMEQEYPDKGFSKVLALLENEQTPAECNETASNE